MTTGRNTPLIGWLALVYVMATLSYAGRFFGGRPPDDSLYRWSFTSSLVQFGIVLAVVLLLARSDPRGMLALRRPASWPQALGLLAVVGVGVAVLGTVLEPLLHPGREQGLTPSNWDSSRAAPFIVNFAIVVLVAPVVEELTFRGLGYSVLRPFGRWFAIVGVGVAFGLAHGLVQALPILIAFGAGLAYVRDRSGSVYPGMLLHASYNAIVLTVAVTT